jgi:hypothetical protein
MLRERKVEIAQSGSNSTIILSRGVKAEGRRQKAEGRRQKAEGNVNTRTLYNVGKECGTPPAAPSKKGRVGQRAVEHFWKLKETAPRSLWYTELAMSDEHVQHTIATYDLIADDYKLTATPEMRAWEEASMRRFADYLPGKRVLVPEAGLLLIGLRASGRWPIQQCERKQESWKQKGNSNRRTVHRDSLAGQLMKGRGLSGTLGLFPIAVKSANGRALAHFCDKAGKTTADPSL